MPLGHLLTSFFSDTSGYDAFKQPDQSVPVEKLINDVLATSRDGKKITAADLSLAITARRAHSIATNPQFSLDAFHSFFGASKYVRTLRVMRQLELTTVLK